MTDEQLSSVKIVSYEEEIKKQDNSFKEPPRE